MWYGRQLKKWVVVIGLLLVDQYVVPVVNYPTNIPCILQSFFSFSTCTFILKTGSETTLGKLPSPTILKMATISKLTKRVIFSQALTLAP